MVIYTKRVGEEEREEDEGLQLTNKRVPQFYFQNKRIQTVAM